MNYRFKIFLGIALAVLMLQPVVVDVAAQGSMPEHSTMPNLPTTPPVHEKRPDGSEFISTDVIAIMANGQAPMIHFWYAADENGTIAKFSLLYLGIVEFEDQNEDDAFQSNETLYYAPLAAYEWTLLTGTTEDDEGHVTEIWLKYIKGGLRSGGMVPSIPQVDARGASAVQRFEDVTIQIWAHIYLYDYEGNVSDDTGVKATYLVQGNSEVKMDIEIGNFPFSTNTSSVALQTLLRESDMVGQQNTYRHRYRIRDRHGNVTGMSSVNWNGAPGNESTIEPLPTDHIQRIDLFDAETGVTQGFYSWVDKAEITWPGGTTEAVNVTASYVPSGTGLAIYLAYPNFDDGTLLHDPSVGVYPEAAPLTEPVGNTTLAVALGAVAVIAVAAFLVRRRR
ncbi:MAG: hypothetical protein ACTSPE_12775 [Candidatus Thorarchaeota archaeon]